MAAQGPDPRLTPFVAGAIWTVDYPVRYAGARFRARMTVIRLGDGRLILHSPCDIDADLRAAITAIGPVGWIVAPGTFHHLHVGAAQAAFPDASTLICPGVEAKQPGLAHDGVLGDVPPGDWRDEIDLAHVPGNRIIAEVLFFHRPSRTLIVTDLIELIGDRTEGVDRVLRFWWKWVTFMWNKPRPAPEYTMGWRDRRAAGRVLRRVLEWDFDRIVLAHGDLVTENGKAVAQEAWAKIVKRR